MISPIILGNTLNAIHLPKSLDILFKADAGHFNNTFSSFSTNKLSLYCSSVSEFS